MTLLQIRCEHYDDLGEHQEALGTVCRHFVLTKWRACELLWCERRRPYTLCYCIVGICKHFFNVIERERVSEKFKIARLKLLFQFFIMIKWDYGERNVKFDEEVNYIYTVHSVHTDC